jgi:hypothetical protein
MKKVFILFAITFIALNLNAQWFAGGKIGLNVKDSKTNADNGKTLNSTAIGFHIAPKGGYYFNEKLALGLSFSIGTNFHSVSDEFNISDSWNMSIPWRISPFVRYSVFTYKKFSLILEGSIAVGGEHRKDVYTYPAYSTYENKEYSTIGIGVLNVIPVLGFKLSDHFQLEAGLNFLNLGYNIDIINRVDSNTMEGEEVRSYKTRTINHDFNIGFNSSSILVVSQLTIGVIYKF